MLICATYFLLRVLRLLSANDQESTCFSLVCPLQNDFPHADLLLEGPLAPHLQQKTQAAQCALAGFCPVTL